VMAGMEWSIREGARGGDKMDKFGREGRIPPPSLPLKRGRD
jgi:hypothetical protein